MKEALFKEITETIKLLLVAASSTSKNNPPLLPQHSAATVVTKGEFLSTAWEL